MPRTNQLRVFAVIAAAVAIAGCRPPPGGERFEVLFSAVSDDGTPMPGVGVTVNEVELGETGPEGGLVLALRAPSGKVLRVDARCPLGYRAPAGDTVLRLRRLAGADRTRERLVVTIECRPAIRRAAVLVRAPGHADFPVTLHGREVARTDEHGLAHLSLALAPGTRFRVGIDTSSNEWLVPRNPTAVFTLEDRDQIFVFDQAFEDQTPEVRRRPRPKPPAILEIESIDKKPWER